MAGTLGSHNQKLSLHGRSMLSSAAPSSMSSTTGVGELACTRTRSSKQPTRPDFVSVRPFVITQVDTAGIHAERIYPDQHSVFATIYVQPGEKRTVFLSDGSCTVVVLLIYPCKTWRNVKLSICRKTQTIYDINTTGCLFGRI